MSVLQLHRRLPRTSGWSLGAAMIVMAMVVTAKPGLLDADEFFLKNGNKLEGRLLNPQERPREKYEIRLTTGKSTSLDAEEVIKFVPESRARRLYLEWLPKMPKDAQGNWKMAEWCRKYKKELQSERKFHLEQVIALDPDHEQARTALRHRKVAGKWMTRDEEMAARGMIKHEGRWALPQEAALKAEQERIELGEKTWRRDIHIWLKKLRRDGDVETWKNFESISDPLAAPAIAELLLKGERDRRLRNLYIRVLSELDSATSVAALIRTALYHPDVDTRELCLDKLPERGRGMAVAAFTKALKNANSEVINRAAEGLKRLKDPEVVPDLIEALVTHHGRKISDGNPGQIGASFGGASDGSSGGTGLNMGGGGVKIQTWTSQNRSVLEALLVVTEDANFKYDKLAWRKWFAEKGAPPNLDLRRKD